MIALDAWARTHAATVRVEAGLARAGVSEIAAPAIGLGAPIDRVFAEPEPVLTLRDRPSQVPAVTWCTGASGEPLLAAGGSDGTALLWNPAAGRLIREFGDASGFSPVRAIAATRTAAGRLLIAAGGSGRVVAIWDGETGDRLGSAGQSYVDSLAWIRTGDDRALLAVGATTVAFVCDESASELWSVTYEGGGLVWVVVASGFDQAGRQFLAVASRDSIDIRDPLSDAPTAVMDPPSHAVLSMAWGKDSDGRSLLAAGDTGGAVTIYDATRHETVRTIDRAHSNRIYGVSLGTTRVGRLLLATASWDHSVRIWEPTAGIELAVIEHPDDVNGVAFAPAGTVLPQDSGVRDGNETLYLATACDDGYVRVYAVRVPAAEQPSRSSHLSEAVVPRGRLEALDGVRFTAPQEPERVLQGHTATVWTIRSAWAPDGRALLASACDDGTARIWDPATGDLVATLDCGSPVESLAWCRVEDGDLRLVTAGLTTPARVWQVSRERISSLSSLEDARLVGWAPLALGEPLAATGNGPRGIRLWKPDTGVAEVELETPGSEQTYIESMAGVVAAGRSYLAVGDSAGEIRILDPQSGELLTVLTGHSSRVGSLAWAVGMDERLLLASASWDGTARVWDALAGDCLGVMSTGVSSWDLGWAVLDDGRLVLATDGGEARCLLCDPVRCTVVAQFEGGRGIDGVSVVPAPDGGALLVAFGVPGGDIQVFRVGIEGAEQAVTRASDGSAPAVISTLVSGAVGLGEWGVWAALGLVGDVVELLDPAVEPGRVSVRLNDPDLAGLASNPMLVALRGLGWRSLRSRLGLAGLIVAGLAPGRGFVPPAGTGRDERQDALLRALAAGVPYRGAGAGVEELRRALEQVPPGVVTLLEVVGEQAVASDPGLPVRLVAAAAGLPALGCDVLAMVSRSLRQLDRTPPAPAPDRAGGGTLELSCDPADRDLVPLLSRRGRPDRVVPTQLALPEPARVPLQATGGLLFRQHVDPPATMPRPAALVLDVSPAVFGPVEVALRLVAHLLTLLVLRAGGQVSLVTTARPRVVVPLEGRRDLVALWTTRSLEAADLRAAIATAAGLDQPVVVLTHQATALDQGLRAGPGLAVVTTHTPGTPPASSAAGHRRLSPRPTSEELSALLDALVDHLASAEAVA